MNFKQLVTKKALKLGEHFKQYIKLNILDEESKSTRATMISMQSLLVVINT